MGFIVFLIAVFGFGILVFVHEFGHFIMGKLFKIKVETFSIGLGPAIFGFKKGETFYQIGAIPFGGFCKFKGEETLENLPSKFSLKKFEGILEKIKKDSTRELLLKSYHLSVPDEILKEDFDDFKILLKKEEDKTLLSNSYEFNLIEKKYVLDNISEYDNKKLYKMMENNNKDLLKYILKKDASKIEKKIILKAVSKEIKIYNLRESDSFYGAPPYKRLFVVLFGPLMNYLIAVVFLSLLAMFPHREYYEPNKIMLIDDLYQRKDNTESPAKKAGLKTGDVILEIDNKKVNTFTEIFENVYNKKDNIKLLIKRDNKELEKTVKPQWDPGNLKYFLGIYSYLDPVIKSNKNNKLQKELGLLDKDRIIGIDDNYDNWTAMNVQAYLADNFSSNKKSIIHVKRGDKIIDIPIVFNEINHKVSEDEFALDFYVPERTIEGKNVGNGIIEGFNESQKYIVMSFHGLYSLIFKPKNKETLNQIGTPILIGYFIGEITIEGFKEGVYQGIRNFLNFISMISLILAFMNLLPIPALDGGYIILNIYEIIFQKSINLNILYKVVMVFFILLLILMFILMPLDILKLIKLVK